jgi:hypothetical protein
MTRTAILSLRSLVPVALFAMLAGCGLEEEMIDDEGEETTEEAALSGCSFGFDGPPRHVWVGTGENAHWATRAAGWIRCSSTRQVTLRMTLFHWPSSGSWRQYDTRIATRTAGTGTLYFSHLLGHPSGGMIYLRYTATEVANGHTGSINSGQYLWITPPRP